jgi:glutamate synthase domain-containing protein 2
LVLLVPTNLRKYYFASKKINANATNESKPGDKVFRYVVILIFFIGAGIFLTGLLDEPTFGAAIGFVFCLSLFGLGLWDFFQTKHSVLRNYPVLGHFRWVAEAVRPELHQYFVESDTGGRPFDRDTRSLVYERAKNEHGEYPFGTENDLYELGYEWFNHSIAPKQAQTEPFRVTLGGPQCTQPYSIALLNVSSMSFGSLSKNAILALNKGAKLGNFAHDTGEGGLSKYHLLHGGDVIWEIGSGYFGCRTKDGQFDLEQFREKANDPRVKAISVKLSQGAKPGLGGVMPASKVTREIAEIRGVPQGQKCVSPPFHSTFKTPRELVQWIQSLREACHGKPVGFKLCVGQRSEFLGICKAIIETKVYPDFITVDGAEGGTGAAPLEFEDHMGSPLSDGLMTVHNALVGCGLREKIKIGCSGKITSGFEMTRRIAQGADFCNSARAMMFALGCIQAQACQTNRCPVGVATQDPKRVRALNVEDKAQRVYHFQQGTVFGFNQFLAAIGLDDPRELNPSLLMRRVSATICRTYAEIYEYLKPGELLSAPPASWEKDWNRSSPDSFKSI